MTSERGTYRDDRRRAAGRLASSIKSAGSRAARAFFGASPAQKKRLRKTVDKRGVKVGDLDMNALDRSRFNAPDKVGESVRLIDIAMGKAPDGPAPDLAPPSPPPAPEAPARPAPRRPAPPPRPTRERERRGPPPSAGAPVEDEEDEEDEQDEQDAERVGLVPRLAAVLALLCLVATPAAAPLLRLLRPDLAVAGAAARGAPTDPWGNAWCGPPEARWSAGPDGHDDGLTHDDLPTSHMEPDLALAAGWATEVGLALTVLFTWLAMALGRLRARRGGVVAEGGRALLFASLPAAAGAGALLWGLEEVALPWPPPPPLREALTEHVAPHLGALGGAPGAAGAWAAACVVLALLARRVVGRAADADQSP
ncbi:MAG: hypothetical protein M9894_02510 [Planctomycetes bacterium]|nr:hypothetical protein [Planctomycetota bacterium]